MAMSRKLPMYQFIEPAGEQHVHIGRNLGTEPVVLYVAYVLPTGSPLSLDADDPGCDVAATK